MSGHGNIETAVEATRLGAFDYIEKPLSLTQLLRTVESALKQQPDTVAPVSGGGSVLSVTETPQGKSPVIEAAREQASGEFTRTTAAYLAVLSIDPEHRLARSALAAQPRARRKPR